MDWTFHQPNKTRWVRVIRIFFFFLLVLWCLMPLSTIFQIYRGVPGANHQTLDLSQVTDKLDHMLYRLSGIQTLNVSGDRY